MRLILFFFLVPLVSFSQSVGIGTTTPNSSAILEIASKNKGLLIPRVTLLSVGDKVTIPNPSKTLLLWNSTVDVINFPDGEGFYYNNGSPVVPNWVKIGSNKSVVKRFEYTVDKDEDSFTVNELKNKKIIEVVREGSSSPKILLDADPFNNNVSYKANTGTFRWAFNLAKTEEIYILYYD
jgi:hypothetical protein